jgi:hypothetical protein
LECLTAEVIVDVARGKVGEHYRNVIQPAAGKRQVD